MRGLAELHGGAGAETAGPSTLVFYVSATMYRPKNMSLR